MLDDMQPDKKKLKKRRKRTKHNVNKKQLKNTQ